MIIWSENKQRRIVRGIEMTVHAINNTWFKRLSVRPVDGTARSGTNDSKVYVFLPMKKGN